MPWVDAVPVPLPFGGKSSMSRQASLRGAHVATVRAGSQASRMLLLYVQHGPLSDSRMAELIGLPEARISARRSGLMVRGFVVYADDVQGAHTTVCRWRVTVAGQRIADRMAG